MIDWINLAFNALWVVALALVLAVFSYSSYLASENHERLRIVLQKKAPQAWFSAAGILFCIGLAGTSETLIYRIVWLVLALLFMVQLAAIFRFRPNR